MPHTTAASAGRTLHADEQQYLAKRRGQGGDCAFETSLELVADGVLER